MNKALIISIILIALLIIGCGGDKKKETTDTGTTTQSGPQPVAPPPMPNIEPGTPQEAYKNMADAVSAFDANKLYTLLSTGAKTQLETMLANIRKDSNFKTSMYAQVKNGQELLAKQFEAYKSGSAGGIDAAYKDQGFLAMALTSCKVEGEKATINEPNGGLVYLVKESGQWKVDFPQDSLLLVPQQPISGGAKPDNQPKP